MQDDPDGKLKQQAWNSLQFLGDKMTLPETNIKTPEHRKKNLEKEIPIENPSFLRAKC